MNISDDMTCHFGQLRYVLLDELALSLGGGLIECSPVDARRPWIVLVNENAHCVLFDPHDRAFDFRLAAVT